MARAGSKLAKMAVLEVMKTWKNVLFSQFSNEIDNVKKKKAWEAVLDKAKQVKVVESFRDIQFMCNKFSHWKSRTIQKRDSLNQTGCKGGRKTILNDVDKAIIEIVGEESPVICGLKDGEVGDGVPFPIYVNNSEDSILRSGHSAPATQETVMSQEIPEGRTCELRIQPRKQLKRLRSKIKELEEQKLSAQIALLKQQEYNMKLQNYELEQRLGVVGSKLTRDVTPVLVELIPNGITPRF